MLQAVIGAGCAGLVSARELVREGHRVQVFEQGESIGGIWNYQEEVEDDLLGSRADRRRVHSSLYSSLRINLPREIMSFSDFPFIPEAMGGRSVDPRRYCRHQEMLLWLEAFVDAHNLRPLIHFNRRVVDITPVQIPYVEAGDCHGKGTEALQERTQQQWVVRTEPAASSATEGSEPRTEVFDAVGVAVGNYHEPNMPDIEGMDSFPGMQLHCHNYRHAELFQGKRVLVVGASFSGQEIAQEVAGVAERVYHSARTWGEEDLSRPPPLPNLERLPMLAGLRADGSARFADGSTVEALHAVLYCTGYKYHYPFLERAGLLSTGNMRVHPLYRHIFVPSAPGLAFIGLLWKSLRNSQFELQAKWVAQVFSGRARLPSRADMEADIQAFYKLLQQAGLPVRYTHCQADWMPVDQWAYNATLASACSLPSGHLEEWRVRLHQIASAKLLAGSVSFRDESSPDEEAAYAAASQACMEMWKRHMPTGVRKTGKHDA